MKPFSLVLFQCLALCVDLVEIVRCRRCSHIVFGTESEVSSPTASAESVFVTLTIDAAEDREVALADIEGAYLEAYLIKLK